MLQKKKNAALIIFSVIIIVAAVIFINSTKKIVTGNALRLEINRMNKTQCIEGWYQLDHVKKDLIITHNHLYMVVLKKQGNEWAVTSLVNPSRFYHFRLQGSTVSYIDLDESGNQVAICYGGIDDTDEPLYIFDLELNRLKEYPHNEFPADIVFVEPENRTFV